MDTGYWHATAALRGGSPRAASFVTCLRQPLPPDAACHLPPVTTLVCIGLVLRPPTHPTPELSLACDLQKAFLLVRALDFSLSSKATLSRLI